MMMPPHSRSRPSWASQDDYAGFNFIVILLGLGVFSYLLWMHYHAQVSAFVMSIMHVEIQFIDRFSDRYRIADQEMAQSAPGNVTLRDLYGITQAVGIFFRIPAMVFILVLAGVCAVRAAPSRFKRKFDLDGLIEEQASGFPVTAAFAKRHLKLLAPQPDKVLPADYALTPAEWIARFAADPSGRFNEQRARATLAAQLGAHWTGPMDTAPPARLLFTVFALHLAERRDEALLLLGDASAGVADARHDGENGPDAALSLPEDLIAQVDRFLEKEMHANEKTSATKIAERHAYATTALMALLTASRIKAGVMAPAQFVWLKLVDRNLWYALHSLGYEIEGTGRYIHPNPRIEALGARCHWAAERAAGRSILKPHLDEAIATLRRYAQAREAGLDV
jgi:intracellular multiplication protein IcmP